MITVIGSLKGGTGKSTVTFNLAVWLAEQGKQVLALDMDPQETLSDVYDIREEEEIEPVFELSKSKGSIPKSFPKTTRKQVLIDVGTANMKGFKEALKIAHRIVVPVPPSQADVWSTQRFLSIINDATASRKKKPEVLCFINRADTHIGVRETDEAEQALFQLDGIKLVPARLGQRTMFRRSFSEGCAVYELEPSGKAAAEFNKLAKILYG